MNQRKWTLALATLLMIGITGGMLVRLKNNQKLGRPGVKTVLLSGATNEVVVLPETVLDYKSHPYEQTKIVLDTLPADTCYGQKMYYAPDGFTVQVSVVLMGSDRTSLHKPQFCLAGSGWPVDDSTSREELVHIERPQPYDLPVTKLLVTRQIKKDDKAQTLRGIYVYWSVSDEGYTTQSAQRMWSMARELFQKGLLQRWANVSYFAVCAPGEEDATFERMKKLMAASVPEFQLTPKPRESVATIRP